MGKLVQQLQTPKEGSQPLHFDSAYSRTLFGQVYWLLWKVRRQKSRLDSQL